MSEFLTNGERKVREVEKAVYAAAEIVGGPGADPLEVFPNPRSAERRTDIVWGDQLTTEQIVAFRGIMAKVGPGRRESQGAAAIGLRPGYNAVLEGGLPHKMKAELDLVINDQVLPRRIFVAATKRKSAESERETQARLTGLPFEETGTTEYGMFRQLVETHPLFVPFPEEAPGRFSGTVTRKEMMQMSIGYSLLADKNSFRAGYVLPDEYDGQFMQLGMLGELPAVLMRVDYFPDPEDPSKTVKPRNAQLMAYGSHIRSAMDESSFGRDAVGSCALVTSATNAASGIISAAELEKNVVLPHTSGHVLTVGVEAMARAKGVEPSEPELQQLAADAYKAANALRRLGRR